MQNASLRCNVTTLTDVVRVLERVLHRHYSLFHLLFSEILWKITIENPQNTIEPKIAFISLIKLNKG